MLTFIFRVFIVFTVFIAGAFVGNIYMPQKTLEQSYIVALQAPETSINLHEPPGLQNALNALTEMKTALEQQTKLDKETIFALENTIKKQLYAGSYQAAKSNYEIQLLKVQKHPQNSDAFLKAKNKYYNVCDMVNAAYPPNPMQEVIVLDTPATAQVNIQISTSTVQSPTPDATTQAKAPKPAEVVKAEPVKTQNVKQEKTK